MRVNNKVILTIKHDGEEPKHVVGLIEKNVSKSSSDKRFHVRSESGQLYTYVPIDNKDAVYSINSSLTKQLIDSKQIVNNMKREWSGNYTQECQAFRESYFITDLL